MLRCGIAAIILSACVCVAQAPTDVSGVWVFTHWNDRFQGTIVLRRSGSTISGTWHTSKGKSEPDTTVSGRIDGNTVTLTRFIGNNQQNYVLTLSPDGKRLDGFGNGWFLNHTNLNMQRKAAAEPSASISTHRSAATTRSAAPMAPMAKKREHLSFPPPRGTWSWVIQSVATSRGSEIKYTSFYYEASTARSVEQPLTLPDGAAIVGVFPDDCEFMVRDQVGNSFTFRNEDEAKTKGLGPGTWSVYPRKCGGVAVFLR